MHPLSGCIFFRYSHNMLAIIKFVRFAAVGKYLRTLQSVKIGVNAEDAYA